MENSPNTNKNNFNNNFENLNVEKTIFEPYNKNIDIVRLDNENFLDKNQNIKDIVANSKNRYTSPSKYLQERNYLNHLAINNYIFNNTNKINFENQLRPT